MRHEKPLMKRTGAASLRVGRACLFDAAKLRQEQNRHYNKTCKQYEKCCFAQLLIAKALILACLPLYVR